MLSSSDDTNLSGDLPANTTVWQRTGLLPLYLEKNPVRTRTNKENIIRLFGLHHVNGRSTELGRLLADSLVAPEYNQ